MDGLFLREDELGVVVMLPSRSMASLDRMTHRPDLSKKEQQSLDSMGFTPETPLFWFNRLKAIKEGQGDGTVLMKTVIEVMDRRGWWILNTPHAYNPKDQERLIRFYQRFGFVPVLKDPGLLVRPPSIVAG